MLARVVERAWSPAPANVPTNEPPACYPRIPGKINAFKTLRVQIAGESGVRPVFFKLETWKISRPAPWCRRRNNNRFVAAFEKMRMPGEFPLHMREASGVRRVPAWLSGDASPSALPGAPSVGGPRSPTSTTAAGR